MPEGPPDSKELGYYFALAQVGLEMVVPLVIGIALDHYLGWKPWATVAGALLGFVGGLGHLIVLVSRHDSPGPSKPGGGAK
ncbi:MAG TPA: AtpZ/AtpI family protein [Gemmataceae bacterium]|jgi:F0F1-type ATP synthase assembly protein I|nr:AtpZ/AtpI family protein [Gemmataceae bacterium]